MNYFYKDKHKKTGYKPRCKSCDKLSLDVINRRAYEKKYREENKEVRAAIVKKSMSKNIEHHKRKRREYLDTEAGNAIHRKHSQTRRARVNNAFVEYVSPMDVYKDQGGVCYLCGDKFTFSEMDCDHVTPLSKGGKHERSNLKMACVFCNRSKGAKLLEELSYQMV